MKAKRLIIMILTLGLLLSGSAYSGSALAKSKDTKKESGITFVDTKTLPLIGAPIQKMWTFKASKSGTYKIVFTYSRSWEKDKPASKTAEYQIKVTKKNDSKSDAAALTEGKVTTVNKNQKFFITLEENPSTGYSWSYKTNSKIITLIKEEELEADGAPSQKQWTFKANKSGTYKIVFTYSRSWEKDNTGSKTVLYTVKVTDEKSSDKTSIALLEDKENTVKTGQKFSVILKENASTGYSWNYEIKDNDIKLFIK